VSAGEVGEKDESGAGDESVEASGLVSTVEAGGGVGVGVDEMIEWLVRKIVAGREGGKGEGANVGEGRGATESSWSSAQLMGAEMAEAVDGMDGLSGRGRGGGRRPEDDEAAAEDDDEVLGLAREGLCLLWVFSNLTHPSPASLRSLCWLLAGGAAALQFCEVDAEVAIVVAVVRGDGSMSFCADFARCAHVCAVAIPSVCERGRREMQGRFLLCPNFQGPHAQQQHALGLDVFHPFPALPFSCLLAPPFRTHGGPVSAGRK
jgi:hypothetical protein